MRSRLKNRAHFYVSCVRVRVRIFLKIFLVIKSFLMNLSLQFYEDPCFCLGDIQLLVKVEVYGLMIEKYPKINPPEMHLFW